MIIVAVVLVAGVLLYLSMRGHLNKVDVPDDHDGGGSPTGTHAGA